MIEHGLEKINLDNPIDGNLSMLINYFVKFYGEKYRDKITERLTNTTYIFSDCAGNVDTYNGIKLYFENKKIELTKSFYKELGVNLKSNNLSFIDFKNWQETLKNYKDIQSLPPVLFNFLASYLKLDNLYMEDQQQQLNKLLLDKKSNLKLQKVLFKFDELYKTKYKQNFDYLESEMQRISKPYQEIFENSSKINEKYRELRINLIKNYLKTNFDLDIGENTDIVNVYENILSTRNFALISTESRTLISQLATKKNFCFKSVDDILNNKEFKELLINKSLKKQLEELEDDRAKELLEYNLAYKKLEKILKESDIYPSGILSTLKDYILNADNIIAYVDHTFKYSTPNSPYAVCVYPSLLSINNSTIVHELNHIVTCDILQNLPFSVYYKCGFYTGILDKDINLFIGSRGSSYLNEVINDYIAVKINDMMEKDGISLGIKPNSPSAYSKAFPLLKDFIEENLDAIIECYMSNDSEIASKRFGNEVLDTLGNITYQLLYNEKSYEIQQEILLTTQADKIDYFELLNHDEYNWSEDTKEYLNYFRSIDLINKQLRLKREPSKPKHAINRKKETQPVSDKKVHVDSNDFKY